MDIARTREAAVNDMKSLEQRGGSTCTCHTNLDAIKQNINPQCGKCGLRDRKKCPVKRTRCRKCNQLNHWEQVCRKKQAKGWKTKFKPQRQSVGQNPQDKASQGKGHTVEEINSDFDELCFYALSKFRLTVPILNQYAKRFLPKSR